MNNALVIIDVEETKNAFRLIEILEEKFGARLISIREIEKSWWYPFHSVQSFYRKSLANDATMYQVLDASRKPIQSETKPVVGEWWGPFHCKECAETCGSFGKTEEQAFDFNHGSDDMKFGVFLGAG
jgi:hypothetical protein